MSQNSFWSERSRPNVARKLLTRLLHAAEIRKTCFRTYTEVRLKTKIKKERLTSRNIEWNTKINTSSCSPQVIEKKKALRLLNPKP